MELKNLGFSVTEIQLSGFTKGQLKEKKIKIDYRRKSFIPENVELLSKLDMKADPKLKESTLKWVKKNPRKGHPLAIKPKVAKKEVKPTPVKKAAKKKPAKMEKKPAKKSVTPKPEKKSVNKAAPAKKTEPAKEVAAIPKAETPAKAGTGKELCDLDKITTGMEKKLNEYGINSCDDLLAVKSIEDLRAASKATKITQKQLKAWKDQINELK